MRKTTIQPTEHFYFPQSLDFLRESGANDRLDQIDVAEGRLTRPLLLEGEPYLVTLRGEEDLQITVQAADNAPEPSDAVMEAAVAWATHRFWLDVEMEAVREAIAVDPFGEMLARDYWPDRPANYATAWDAMLISIAHAQVYPGLAKQLDDNLAIYYGREVTFGGTTYHLTPTPQELLKASPDELRGHKFSRQKAKYLTQIPRTVVENPDTYDFAAMRQRDGQEVVKQLRELYGVGAWTSQNVAMRGLPHKDVFIDESTLRETLQPHYFRPESISKSEYAEITERFAPYRSFACYYSYMHHFNYTESGSPMG